MISVIMHISALVVVATIIATINAKPVSDDSWLQALPTDEDFSQDTEPRISMLPLTEDVSQGTEPETYTETTASSDTIPDPTTDQSLVAFDWGGVDPQNKFMNYACTSQNGVCCRKSKESGAQIQHHCSDSTFSIHSFAFT